MPVTVMKGEPFYCVFGDTEYPKIQPAMSEWEMRTL